MITTPEGLSSVRETHAADSIVLTSGVYDLLHPGHVEHLRAAKAMGKVVTVGLWSDSHVAARKGLDRPFIPIDDRLALIDELKPVDYVFEITGEGARKDLVLPLISNLEPEFYLLSDRRPQFNGLPYLEHDSGRITSIVHDVTYANKRNSTTDIAERVRSTAHGATITS